MQNKHTTNQNTAGMKWTDLFMTWLQFGHTCGDTGGRLAVGEVGMFNAFDNSSGVLSTSLAIVDVSVGANSGLDVWDVSIGWLSSGTGGSGECSELLPASENKLNINEL